MQAQTILPDEIRFRERLRGYDPDEVDAYVVAVGKGAAQMQGRLRELQERVDKAESLLAKQSMVTESAETLNRTMVLAQRAADAAMAEAQEEAGTILEAANAQADEVKAETEADCLRIRATAARELDEAMAAKRVDLETEIRELKETRAELKADVGALDGHLAMQRARLRSTLTRLQALLDDPRALMAVESSSLGDTAGEPSTGSSTDDDTDHSEVAPAAADHQVVPDAAEATDPAAGYAAGDTSGEAAEGSSSGGGSSAGMPSDDEGDTGDPSPVVAEQVAATALSGEPEKAPAQPAHAVLQQSVEPSSSFAGMTEGSPAGTATSKQATSERATSGRATSGTATSVKTASGAFVTVADCESPVEQASLGAALQSPHDEVSTGVATQPIPVLIENPAEEWSDGSSELFQDEASDPFIEQLRQVAAGDGPLPNWDEAMAAFFDQDEEKEERGWFGRRR